MVRDTGFEPVTPSVSRKCSTTELTAHDDTCAIGQARIKRRYVKGRHRTEQASSGKLG